MADLEFKALARGNMNIQTSGNDFKIDYLWDDPGGVSAPELAATWARVTIECGGSIASIIRNKRIGAIRSDIYAPLYAIAEWFVRNWWFIFNECSAPDKITDKQFQARHNLAFCPEGICLPAISFSKNGDDILVKWNTIQYESAGLQFLTTGGFLVDETLFRNRVSQLITDTVQRLGERNVKGTFLEEEWNAIRCIDPRERRFCEIASRVGIDPFSVEEDVSEGIIKMYERTAPELRDELMYACSPHSLDANARWIDEAGKELKIHPHAVSLQVPRVWTEKKMSDDLPWAIGYDWAREFRNALKAKTPMFDFSDYGIKKNANIISMPFRDSSIEGLVNRKERDSFSLALNRENIDVHDPGTRFLLARALCETLATQIGRSAMITRADSKMQKITRAFAAELLAPAAEISKMVKADTIGSEEIHEIRERFAVSELVILHQVVNHDIAKIESSDTIVGAI